MSHKNAPADASRDYALAYAAHYSEKNLEKALTLYLGVLSSNDGRSPEAAYSRAQIANIVRAVIPPDELLEAEVALALAALREPRPSQ